MLSYSTHVQRSSHTIQNKECELLTESKPITKTNRKIQKYKVRKVHTQQAYTDYHTHIYKHTRTNTHTNTHTYIYTHTHTHTHSRVILFIHHLLRRGKQLIKLKLNHYQMCSFSFFCSCPRCIYVCVDTSYRILCVCLGSQGWNFFLLSPAFH